MNCKTITLILAFLFFASCLTHADAGSQLDEKKHIEMLYTLFQYPLKKIQFDSDARIFLEKNPNSDYRNVTEYMMALNQYEISGSSDLLVKLSENETMNPMLVESSLFILAQISFSKKNFSETEVHFKNLLSLSDINNYFLRETMYGRSLIQIDMKKWDKAGKILKKLINKNPTYAKQEKIIYTHGYILYKQGKYADACDQFKILKTSAALYYQAKCLEKTKKYIPAAIIYKQLITQFPDIAFKDKAQFSLAECFYISTDYISALKEYNSFITEFSTSSWIVSARYKTGCCYYNMKNYPKAVEIFTNITKDSPLNSLAPCAKYMQAEALFAQGSIDAALNVYEELVIEFNKNISVKQAYYKIGWCYTQKNDHDKAITAFSILVSKYPDDELIPYALFLIGENYRKKNDLDKAIGYYQQAINHPLRTTELLDTAIFMAVKTFYEQGKYDAIVSNFQYIINNLPQHRSEMNPYTHLLIAEAYYYLGHYTQANKNYDSVISTYPFGVPASYCREGKAWANFQSLNYPEAMKERELLRDDWLITHSEAARMSNEFEVGDIYFNQKKYVEALDVFERFMNDYPSSDKIPEALFNAGRCYYKLAYYTKAIELWEKLVTSYELSNKQSSSYAKSKFAEEALGLIADTYFRTQKYEQAQQTCLKIIAEYPGTELADKAQLRIAQSNYNALDDKKAIEEFEKCIAVSKDEETRNTAFEGLLASTYRLNESEPDSDYDIRVLEKNIAAYPASKHAAAMQYRVAERYYDKKDYAKAAEEFRKVVSDFASSDNAGNAMFYSAESLYHDARYEEAAAAYTRFIDNYPKNESLRIGYLHLANSLFYLEKYSEAAAKYLKLSGLGKEGKEGDEIVITAFFNASLCYKKDMNWEAVISVNKQFVSRFRSNPRAKDALLEIASAYETLSNYDKSIQSYKELFTVLADSDVMRCEIQYKIAKFHIKTGNIKFALEEFKKLIMLKPADDVWRLSGIAQLAQEYENQKDWPNALMAYEEILRSTQEPKWISVSQERIDLIKKEMSNITTQ